jgi:mannose-6-phosphate isomerase-like protein (cupin superfamily)
MLNETPFADVRETPDGCSIPELKWRELLFTGALRAEGDLYVRDPARPMAPFARDDPFPADARFRVRRAGDRVEVARVAPAPAPPSGPDAAAGAGFDLARLQAEQLLRAQRYIEFLRVPALSLGLYRLPAGGVDAQQPHTEDEVYLVLAGRARLSFGEHDQPVGPGSLVFVPARLPHRFHAIEEDLSVLVVFAPAESAAG